MKLKQLFLFLFVGLAFFFTACDSGSGEGDIETIDENGEVVNEDNNEDNMAVCIWNQVSVRETPADKGKWVTSLNLGEKIEFLGETEIDTEPSTEREYAKVKLLDGTVGWVRYDLIATNAKAAAVMTDVNVYKRPDMLTKSEKKFVKMDIIAVKNSDIDGWVEVIGKGKNNSWLVEGYLKPENVTYDEVDIAAATFVSKALAIEDEEKFGSEIESIFNNTDLQSTVFFSDIEELYFEYFPEEPYGEGYDDEYYEEEYEEGEYDGGDPNEELEEELGD